MSKKYIAIVLGTFILLGGAFFFVLYWGSKLPVIPNPVPAQYTPPAPPAPPAPSAWVSLEKSKKGNLLHVKWSNLPANTTALHVFRSLKGKNNWVLWKTITPDNLAGGDIAINIGNADYSNYDFYIQAVGSGNGTGAGETVIWTSSSTNTQTPPPPPDTVNNGNSNSSSTDNTGNNSNNTSTGNSNNNSGSGTSSAQQGTPYYTPQLQLSGYGQNQSGNFWVQHVDQKIQIGWQNLPPPTTNLVVYRSPNQDGPWNAVLTQENPGVNGAYSIQVVDDTLGQPFYYEMYANAGATTIQTYGPVYLPPVGQ